jgi:hypothetical protein
MIPLFYKIMAVIAVWVIAGLVIIIKLGGWADDNYGTGALILVVCASAILLIGGLMLTLVMIIPYLV